LETDATQRSTRPRSELPLPWIPSRTPHPLGAFAITVASLAFAFGAQYLLLGADYHEVQLSTVFPAFILIAIYAGWRWSLAAVTLVGILIGRATAMRGEGLAVVDWISLGLYIASALITVLVAGAVRELVIRINEESDARLVAERLRKESEGRFGALADSAPTPMWVTGPDRKRAFVNTAYADFLGVSPEVAKGFDWRRRLHPDDVERVVREQIAGESSREPFALEARYSRADGEWRWLRSVSRPRLGVGGEVEGFIGIAFDITDAKRAEADLLHINELLADRVDAALTERDEAQAAFMQSQKLEAVGQLTGGVAHDFNNLLTVVIGALDIIERHPDDEGRRARMMEAALSAARRGERLTQQLLAFSRRQPLRPEVLEVDRLLTESESLLRRVVGEGEGFEFSLGAPGRYALVDGSQLEAAVLNLVINARDAIGASGRIELATTVVILTEPQGEAMPGHYLAVCVKDDGPGMSAETAAHAFEPFFTTKAIGKGTGLGLSQVYGFARQSGGDVDIRSHPGEGAMVRILLPLTAGPKEARAIGMPTPAQAGRALKVLLVEDRADVAELVEAMLRELGHEVIIAPDARAALDKARRHPDLGLVLTDVIMPGGRTGVDLARDLTAERPALPVILSSGYTGEALAGAEDAPWPLLRKPYTLEDLAQVIAATVGAPVETADTTIS
jgi:PAS domain S-box-containing protein